MNSDDIAIAALRGNWISAIRTADVDSLASLVTDDVVVVHGDGRCIRGRGQFRDDFQKAFEFFRIAPTILDPQVSIRGNWAFEIAKVKTTLRPLAGDKATRVITTTMVVLRRHADGDWRVARVLELIERDRGDAK